MCAATNGRAVRLQPNRAKRAAECKARRLAKRAVMPPDHYLKLKI